MCVHTFENMGLVLEVLKGLFIQSPYKAEAVSL